MSIAPVMFSVNGGLQVIVAVAVLRRIILTFPGAARSPIIQTKAEHYISCRVGLNTECLKGGSVVVY